MIHPYSANIIAVSNKFTGPRANDGGIAPIDTDAGAIINQIPAY